MKYGKFFKDNPNLQQSCNGVSNQRLSDFLTLIDENAKGGYVALFQDKRKMSDIFFAGRSSMSRRTFRAYRYCLIKYMEWRDNKSALALIHSLQYKSLIFEDTIKNSLFRSYIDMISYIDSVGFASSPKYTSNDLLDVKAIATLMWLGVSHDDIAQLKVDDLSEYCVVQNEKIRKTLSPQQYEIMKRYAALEQYNAPPECETTVIIPRNTSDLLYVKSIPYITITKRTRPNLPHSERLDMFNAMVTNAGYNVGLKLTQLRKNAAFEYVKFHKTAGQTIPQAIEAYGYSMPDAYTIAADYKIWDNIFYPSR